MTCSFIHPLYVVCFLALLGLAGGSIGLSAEVGSSCTSAREESSKDWLNDGSEDDLSAIGDWKSHPEDQNELEDIVECYKDVSCDPNTVYYI